MVTIRDVAKQSGFSAATVSIVLNNAPLARYIPATTKGRIEKAAQTLGYRPNVIARFLRSKRSHTVGVMVFDLTDPFCVPILRGIENALFQASYLPILMDVHNQRGRFERYLEMLLDRRVEGLIVVANWLFVDINLLGDIEKRNIPAAIIGRELKTDSISSIMVDNETGARRALEHLYSLGHRRIAFIRGPKTLADTVPRWRGVLSFAHSVKLPIDSKLTADLPDSLNPNSSFENGYKLTEMLWKRRRRFTALMAFDDLSAFGAIRALPWTRKARVCPTSAPSSVSMTSPPRCSPCRPLPPSASPSKPWARPRPEPSSKEWTPSWKNANSFPVTGKLRRSWSSGNRRARCSSSLLKHTDSR